MVCLSEYLPLRNVYILVIKVCFAKRSRIAFFFLFKCCLGLPVVHEVGGVVTMKSIDMYIVHDSSLVVSFPNISAYFASIAETLITQVSLRKSCSCRRFCFNPFPPRRPGASVFGRDRVLVFGFSGVMISIKSIDLHIGHGRSERVCIAKTLRIYRIGKNPWLASCLSVPR